MKIDFEKIINQAITTVITAVFVGACVVVWKGATTVDDKVKKTKDDLEYLITSLSEKLANYEASIVTYESTMRSISNQLTMVIRNQSDLAAYTRKSYMKPPGGLDDRATNTMPQILDPRTNRVILEEQSKQMIQQAPVMQQRDMYRQLKRRD